MTLFCKKATWKELSPERVNFHFYEGVQAMGSYDLLIVDDQAGVRRLLYEVFLEEGYRVEVAASGPEAIQKVLAEAPDLILLDNKMPVMSGIETAQEIFKLNYDLSIIMMTAYGEVDVTSQAKKLGINHYLAKPFDLNEVRHLVKTLLINSRHKKRYLEEIS